MSDQKITIKIDEDGKISAQTEGFKGEFCLKELESLLQGIADIGDVKKMDDYYQKQVVATKEQIKRKTQ